MTIVVLAGLAAAACPSTLPADAVARRAGYAVLANAEAPRPAAIGAKAGSRWRSVQFSDGPPAERAWLAPDGPGRAIQTWSFAPTRGRSTYLSCGYGPGAPILARPITAKRCSVRYTARAEVTTLACR
jgi:hypothetical protein